MGLRTFTFTNEGLIETVAGGKSNATSAVVELGDAGLVMNTLSVSQNTTGSVGFETLVFADSPCVVLLPDEPIVGQCVTICSVDGTTGLIGVSGSHNINGSAGRNFFGAYAVRDFYFVSNSVGWTCGANGGTGGTFGSFTF